MSQTLSELSTGNVPSNVKKSNFSQVGESSTSIYSANWAEDYQHDQQARSLFSGAVYHSGQVSISINSLN